MIIDKIKPLNRQKLYFAHYLRWFICGIPTRNLKDHHADAPW